MKKIKLIVEFEYDDVLMYGEDDKEAEDWFFDEIMTEPLVLHSNLIGDEVGIIKVLGVV